MQKNIKIVFFFPSLFSLSLSLFFSSLPLPFSFLHSPYTVPSLPSKWNNTISSLIPPPILPIAPSPAVIVFTLHLPHPLTQLSHIPVFLHFLLVRTFVQYEIRHLCTLAIQSCSKEATFVQFFSVFQYHNSVTFSASHEKYKYTKS